MKFLMLLKYYKMYKNDILIHPFSYIGTNTIIGKGTNINGKCYIGSGKNAAVSIGRYCAIAHNLRIRVRNHSLKYPNIQDKFQNRHNFNDLSVLKGDVEIGNACWIADNVTILPGITIGNGAVVGAGSVVTKNVAPYSVVAGNPAKLIKYRFDKDIIDQLEQICWWSWDKNKIEKNTIFFNTDLTEYSGKINKLIS